MEEVGIFPFLNKAIKTQRGQVTHPWSHSHMSDQKEPQEMMNECYSSWFPVEEPRPQYARGEWLSFPPLERQEPRPSC